MGTVVGNVLVSRDVLEHSRDTHRPLNTDVGDLHTAKPLRDSSAVLATSVAYPRPRASLGKAIALGKHTPCRSPEGKIDEDTTFHRQLAPVPLLQLIAADQSHIRFTGEA